MSSGLSRLLILVLLASSLGGCRSLFKKRESEATSAAPVATAAPPVATTAAPVAPAPVADAPAVDEGQVPASQDFEDEAFDKVTAGNYKAEFAKLQAEIEKK